MLKEFLSKHYFRNLVTILITSGSLVSQCWFPQAVQGQTQPYCRFTTEEIAKKSNLRQASFKGNSDAKKKYKTLLKKHKDILQECRTQTWPQTQAIWLRLYPCDVRSGAIDEILDHIVNKGYNRIHLEVFFDSQVLLPPNDNPTSWDTVVRSPGAEKVDLLAETIKKGHERGLKVYAWLFTMNFGYTYAQRPDRQDTLARNGRGEDSLSFVHDHSQAFIDPYNRQAQTEFYQLVEATVKRKPDGVLFDYIRYPRGTGSQSVVSKVKDLWIYGRASREALYQRAQNNQGRMLIQRFVSRGYITQGDIKAAKQKFPQERTPLWQGRNPLQGNSRQRLQLELWHLSVAHAAQGVIDFLALASIPAQKQNIPVGAVFFPGGNQIVGERGFDSRLQPWDRFPTSLEWHPMSYGICGNTSCIVDEVKRVTNIALGKTPVMPVIAGMWGQSSNKRPSLEAQMEAIRRAAPQINSVSHFAYSWQEPELDRERKFCDLLDL